MPIIAIGAAVYAGVTMATVGIAAMSTMAIISAVGAIAAGVGVVTGSKELQTIGAVASLAGGIGSFAQGTDLFSSGVGGIDDAGLAGDYVNQMDVASDAASATSQNIAAKAPGVADPTAGLAGAPVSPAAEVGAAVGGEVGGLMNSSPTAAAIAEPSSQVADAVSTYGNDARAGARYAPTATSSGVFDSIKSFGSFLNENKDLASMGMKFVGGMFDDSADKKAELDKQKMGNDTRMTDAQIGLYGAKTSGELLNQQQQRQQMANANSVPDLTGITLKQGLYSTKPPPIYNAPRVGLMNSTGR